MFEWSFSFWMKFVLFSFFFFSRKRRRRSKRRRMRLSIRRVWRWGLLIYCKRKERVWIHKDRKTEEEETREETNQHSSLFSSFLSLLSFLSAFFASLVCSFLSFSLQILRALGSVECMHAGSDVCIDRHIRRPVGEEELDDVDSRVSTALERPLHKKE